MAAFRVKATYGSPTAARAFLRIYGPIAIEKPIYRDSTRKLNVCENYTGNGARQLHAFEEVPEVRRTSRWLSTTHCRTACSVA
jgi:hypothetical protein